jgi:hypothetical protein
MSTILFKQNIMDTISIFRLHSLFKITEEHDCTGEPSSILTAANDRLGLFRPSPPSDSLGPGELGP